MSLTRNQVGLIKATIPILKDHGTAITCHFYYLLLSQNPTLNNIFNLTNQKTGHQSLALASSLHAYASNIDDLGVLSPALQRICHKHASMSVKAEHYSVVGEYLLRAMGHVLGEALTTDTMEAWEQAYWQLADMMIKQEASLYNSAAPWTTWRDFRITKKVVESSVITSFYFTPLDDMPLPRYKPGQYISISTCIPSLHHKQNRQYTLSDSPNKLHYRISVKRESPLDKNPNGIFSNMLHDTKNEGDILQLSHPFGDFYVDAEENADRAMVLISAGVGITPMLAILNSFICSQQPAAPPPRISFIHASRNSHSQAFASHIANVTASHDSITSSMFVKSPSENAIKGQDYHFQGRMDLGRLDRRVDLLLGDCQTRYYICGPAGFMRDMSVALCGFGVQESRVKLEIFGTGNLDQLG